MFKESRSQNGREHRDIGADLPLASPGSPEDAGLGVRWRFEHRGCID